MLAGKGTPPYVRCGEHARGERRTGKKEQAKGLGYWVRHAYKTKRACARINK